MNLTDILAQAGGIESMAKDLGIPPAMAKQGAEALLPAILGGFKKQAAIGRHRGAGRAARPARRRRFARFGAGVATDPGRAG